MLLGQGLQQRLHLGLEFHNGLTVTRIFLWSGPEGEKGKVMVSGCQAGRRSSHSLARTRESRGVCGLEHLGGQRCVEFLRQSSWE